ncbi:uncharacterized protein JCM15063_005275 [Sporobolomyces koalae]|uniref:uncharacterized protein n=1 Tax=Sporobolomyces koalae TaxID=500713 RepID=UPI0031795A30
MYQPQGPSGTSPAFTEPIVPFSRLGYSFLKRSGRALALVFAAIVGLVLLHTSDLVLYLLNLVSPAKSLGRVVPPAFSPAKPPSPWSHPFAFVLCNIANVLGQKSSPAWLWDWSHWSGIGFQGEWGTIFTDESVSRSPCPALNALANCGALPRDGRNITQQQLSAAISRAYNLTPTLAIQLGLPFSVLFEGRGKIDLEDLSAQGLVQHDGSATREDLNSPHAAATVAATQGRPSLRLIDLYWPASNQVNEYTWQNEAAILAHARRESRSRNGQFVLSPLAYVFSSGNVALMHIVCGGKLEDLRAWLGGHDTLRGVEGFLPGFEPKARQAWGVSILQAQLFTALVELTCGSLDDKPRALAHLDDIQARNGWNAMEGKTGDDA